MSVIRTQENKGAFEVGRVTVNFIDNVYEISTER